MQLNHTYFPSELIHLSGLKVCGSGKNSGSWDMKEILARNAEPFGNLYGPTVVGAVVVWNNDVGATLDTLCISVTTAVV